MPHFAPAQCLTLCLFGQAVLVQAMHLLFPPAPSSVLPGAKSDPAHCCCSPLVGKAAGYMLFFTAVSVVFERIGAWSSLHAYAIGSLTRAQSGG